MEQRTWELSDHELLFRCRNNDLKAYEALFFRYSKRLHNYGIKYLESGEVAEEKMMDVMVWIWENRTSIPADVNFEAYIFKAMKNASAMAIRKRILHTISFHEQDVNETPDPSGADANLVCKELTASYLDKLHKLSPQRRKAYLLSREEGLSHASIAKELNISINTVKNHIKASMLHFRTQLQEYTNTLYFLLLTFLSIYWNFFH